MTKLFHLTKAGSEGSKMFFHSGHFLIHVTVLEFHGQKFQQHPHSLWYDDLILTAGGALSRVQTPIRFHHGHLLPSDSHSKDDVARIFKQEPVCAQRLSETLTLPGGLRCQQVRVSPANLQTRAEKHDLLVQLRISSRQVSERGARLSAQAQRRWAGQLSHRLDKLELLLLLDLLDFEDVLQRGVVEELPLLVNLCVSLRMGKHDKIQKGSKLVGWGLMLTPLPGNRTPFNTMANRDVQTTGSYFKSKAVLL